MYGVASDDTQRDAIARPDPETRASNIYDQLRTRAEAMRQAQDEEGGGADAGPDVQDDTQQEAQEGFFPPSDFGIEGDGDGKVTTPEQRAKAEAAKQQRINRMVDRGEDLKAMNEGITDTAGFGASEAPKTPAESSKKAVAARGMLERLKERQAQAAAQATAVEQYRPVQKEEGGQQYL